MYMYIYIFECIYIYEYMYIACVSMCATHIYAMTRAKRVSNMPFTSPQICSQS